MLLPLELQEKPPFSVEFSFFYLFSCNSLQLCSFQKSLTPGNSLPVVTGREEGKKHTYPHSPSGCPQEGSSALCTGRDRAERIRWTVQSGRARESTHTGRGPQGGARSNLPFPKIDQREPWGAELTDPWGADITDTIHTFLDFRCNSPEQMRYLKRLKRA